MVTKYHKNLLTNSLLLSLFDANKIVILGSLEHHYTLFLRQSLWSIILPSKVSKHSLTPFFFAEFKWKNFKILWCHLPDVVPHKPLSFSFSWLPKSQWKAGQVPRLLYEAPGSSMDWAFSIGIPLSLAIGKAPIMKLPQFPFICLRHISVLCLFLSFSVSILRTGRFLHQCSFLAIAHLPSFKGMLFALPL